MPRAGVLSFSFQLSVVVLVCTLTGTHFYSAVNSTHVRVDAFEAGSWNGIVMVADDLTSFQVRVGTQAEFGDYIDGDNAADFLKENFKNSIGGRRPGQWAQHLRTAPLYHAVKEVGPHAPDGSYCRLVWNPLHPYDTGSRIELEWTRLDEQAVLGKVTYAAPYGQIDYNADSRVADLILEAYSPWDDTRGMVPGIYSLAHEGIFAFSEYRPVLDEREWDRWLFHFSSDKPGLPPEDEPGRVQRFFDPSMDDREWKMVRWGAYWQEEPGIKSPGYGWYRQRILLPVEWRGKTLRFDLGKISESDWTFLNGMPIGSQTDKDVKRTYEVRPGDSAYARILWGQDNLLSVQIRSTGTLGGASSGRVHPSGRGDPPPRPRVVALADASRKIGFAVVASRGPTSSGTYENLSDLQRQIVEKGQLTTLGGSRYGALHFADFHEESKRRSADRVLYFLIALGEGDSRLVTEAKRKLSGLDPDRILAERRGAYEKQRVRSTGEFAGAAEMAANTLHWSVLYAPEQKRAFVVDSRRWCVPNQWFLAGNSAVMSAWGAALESQEMAQNTLVGILKEQLPNGKVLNMAGSWFSTPDRSQDMFAAYAAWKIYTKYRDRNFLQEVYPRIKQWHEWWFADRGDGQPRRDGNRNGLLEIGSDGVPADTPQDPPDSEAYGDRAQTAYWESFDDSPMYNNVEHGPAVHPARYVREPGVRFVYRTGTLNLDLVHTNALYALNAECLARLAEELGIKDDAEKFRRQYARTKQLMNQLLWDEKTGLYLNRLWESEGSTFSYRKASAHFWVLAAGIPDQRQANRMVKEHLLNPKEFWGEFILPSISRDDPAFVEQYYWRGAIWPPMNYFVYEGLKRYGFDESAGELAQKTYSLVKANWDSTGGLYENYSAINGKGDPGGAQTTIHYSWSATLPLLAVMELIDVEAWGGLRFGSPGLRQSAKVENIVIAGNTYAVEAGRQTKLWRNGEQVFEADGPVVVRNFEWSPSRVGFLVKGGRGLGKIHIGMKNLDKKSRFGSLILDGKPSERLQLDGGKASFDLSGGQHSVEFRLR